MAKAEQPVRDDAWISYIGAGFADRSLPASEFSHQAHWAAVIWLLAGHDPAWVAQEMPGMIRAFNEAHGGVNSDSEGYHETISLASIAAAAHQMEQMPGADNSAVLAAIFSAEFGDPNWLLRHWRRDTLFAPSARRHWVAPDLVPLPFGVFHPLAKVA